MKTTPARRSARRASSNEARAVRNERGVRISLPRDWSDLGRWVLTEAMQRALLDAARPRGAGSRPREATEPTVIAFPRLARQPACETTGARA